MNCGIDLPPSPTYYLCRIIVVLDPVLNAYMYHLIQFLYHLKWWILISEMKD